MNIERKIERESKIGQLDCQKETSTLCRNENREFKNKLRMRERKGNMHVVLSPKEKKA